MQKFKSTEKTTQKAILNWLEAMRIFHFRNNSGAIAGEYAGRKRFFRFGAVGSPDIICVVGGKFVGIECKGENGKMSDNQAEFASRLVHAGGEYLLAHSVDDVIKNPIFKKA